MSTLELEKSVAIKHPHRLPQLDKSKIPVITMADQLDGSEGDDERLYTNFLHNRVARDYNLTIEFVCNRVWDAGAWKWEAKLFVDGTLAATGHGARKGHAKNNASRTYVIERGFGVPEP